jgi:hypothetical protein
MPVLISPRLVPFIDYSTIGEYDAHGHWIPDLSKPMTIRNDYGAVLKVEGRRLKRQLSEAATIYRNEGIAAVPRKLLTVYATVEAGCLRGTNAAKSQTGLLFRMNMQYCREWNLGHSEWGLTRSDVENDHIKDWGLVCLTSGLIVHYGFFFTASDAEITASEWGGGRCSYDELVEREFAANE